MIDKAEIECRFRKRVESYDENALTQRLIIDRLCNLLKEYLPYSPAKVLEIGCGTGLLTERLRNDLTSCKDLFINDLVKEMCHKAARRCRIPENTCLIGDIENLSVPYHFELIASASTFQWFADAGKMFKKLAHHLDGGNFLIFSTFGEDNLKEIKSITGNGLTYLPLEEIKLLLSPYFDVLHASEDRPVVYFSEPIEILRHIQKTGVNATSATPFWTKGHLQQFARQYEDFCINGRYPLTYHPLYLVCKRKESL